MPQRMIQSLTFNAVVGLAGLFGTFLGFAIEQQNEPHRRTAPATAIGPGPGGYRAGDFSKTPQLDGKGEGPTIAATDGSPAGVYTGKALAVASAATTVLVMVGKTLTDFWFDHRRKRLELVRLETESRLEDKRKESEARIARVGREAESRLAILERVSEARTQADAEARQKVLAELTKMSAELGAARGEVAAAHADVVKARQEAEAARAEAKAARTEAAAMSATLDATRKELAEARIVIDHTDKDIKQTKGATAELTMRTAQGVQDLLKGQEEIRANVLPPSPGPDA